MASEHFKQRTGVELKVTPRPLKGWHYRLWISRVTLRRARNAGPAGVFERPIPMFQVSDSDMPIRGTTFPGIPTRMKQMSGGLIGSFVLHLLVILLIVFGLPWLTSTPPQVEQVIPVNLVQLAENTGSPSSAEVAPLPQEKAKEVSTEQPAAAVPIEQTPPPQAAQHQAEERSMPNVLTAIKPEQKPEVPKTVKAHKPDASPAAKLQRQPLPADDLSVRLKALAQLRQPAPPMPPNPRQQDGSGASNLTATSANAARTRDATYSVKDFIRAQVERRWYLDRDIVKSNNWTVAIHIVMRSDGRVSKAEIVDDPRYRSNKAYSAFALSARNAVLLSSPLNLPSDYYDIAKDIVVDFDSKRVSQ